MNHIPRKRFGQNFLQDSSIIERIVDTLHLKKDDNVVEIGPGMGALTKLLLPYTSKLSAIEIDRDLYQLLMSCFNHFEHFKLINQDALSVDFSELGTDLRVIGNLPYNISTPLILHLMTYISNIKDMHFMLQKEMALRLAGQPGSKDYGRLSILMQYHCEIDYLFDVPPEAFFPTPKVNSAVICLTPYEKSPWPEVSLTALKNLLSLAFSMRRKTLANNLKPIITADELLELGFDPKQRPEQISIMDYIQITRHFKDRLQGERIVSSL